MSATDLLIIIAVVILLLWVIGLIFTFMPAPLLWILFVIGLIFLLVWLFKRRKK